MKPIYFLPKDDLVRGALVPSFRASGSVDCMMGFFSSAALSAVAPGLATFINATTGSLRLIISPFLQATDQAALEAGTMALDQAVEGALRPVLVSEEALEQHTLKCLSYLVSVGRIEIRIALMKAGLFHPKVWLFHNEGDTLAVHGSGNMTAGGVRVNFEQLNVSRSWEDPNQNYVVKTLAFQFDRLWEHREDSCLVVPLPEAIRSQLLESYPANQAPSEDDFDRLYRKASGSDLPSQAAGQQEAKVFGLPPGLQFGAPPYQHQPKAVEAWIGAGGRGLLEMATGSGKTITAMVAAHSLAQTKKPLLIVMSAPYLPILDQWASEAARFGLVPIQMAKLGGPSARAEAIAKARRALRSSDATAAAIVVSHTTLCDPEFQAKLRTVPTPKLLIADEVHNLGREAFSQSPPEFFEYRLGLSATPVRQYDEEGTKFLQEYFGETVFRFPLKDAIGSCLVEYDYFVHPVPLTSEEMDRWGELSEKIRQNSWRGESGEPDDLLAKLFRDRRLVLEAAASKIEVLARLLDSEKRAGIRHTLIYASDKQPEQLQAVNDLLKARDIPFHQLTALETSNPDYARRVIRAFQEGSLAVLTAKRVLDEGVDIPQVRTAYILASTTVERQWIQRRGRVLRRCPQLGKTHSIIHDFVVEPPPGSGRTDADEQKVVASELKRVLEFATLSRNAGRPDGAIPAIRRMMNSITGE